MNKKLDIFEQSNFISGDERRTIDKWCEFFSKDDVKAVETFITHLVMMVHRRHSDERIEALDVSLLSQVMNSRCIEETFKLVESIQCDFTVSQEEKGYLLLHICNILEKRSSYE